MEPEQPQANDNNVSDNPGSNPVVPEPLSQPVTPESPISPSQTPLETTVVPASTETPLPSESVPQPGLVTPSPFVGPTVISPTPQVQVTPTASGPASPSTAEAPTAVLGGAGLDQKKGGKGKQLLITAVATVVLALGIGGFVFGYYLPNKPENVWKTGMTRTADELDTFVEKLSDPAIMETLTKNKLTITGKYESDQGKVDLNVDSKFDKKSTDSTIGIEASGEALEQDINIDAAFKTQIVDDSIWPNVYLKISGFSDLGFDGFLPGINDFDGKWVALEQDFYKEFINQESDNTDTEDQFNLTQDDVASIARDVATVTNEYIFTTDESKAVFQMKEFIGVEESEGIKANRYRTQFNQENAANYCKALVDKLFANAAVRRLDDITDENRADKIESAKESCDFSDDNASSDRVAFKDDVDVWIDKKFKILHKVRMVEDLEAQGEQYKKEKTECEDRFAVFDSGDASDFCDYYDDRIETGERYIEFGQIYNGNDEVRLFMTGKSDTNNQKYTYRGDLSVQIKTLIVNGRISYTDESEDNKSTVSVDIKTEPYDGDIDASRPEGATPIMDVYEYIQQKASEQRSQSFYGGESLGASTDDEDQSSVPGGLFNILSL